MWHVYMFMWVCACVWVDVLTRLYMWRTEVDVNFFPQLLSNFFFFETESLTEFERTDLIRMDE